MRKRRQPTLLGRARYRGRRRRIDQLDGGPLDGYYRHRRQGQINDPDRPWDDASYLVLDVETSGLDPARDHLLSAGWVCIDHGAISADSARHALIRPPDGTSVGSSATLHRITDTAAAGGLDVERVLTALLGDLQGRVLVCHFAQLELGFLGAACERSFGCGFWPYQLVDTMQWHLDRARRTSTPVAGEDLRLHALLQGYGLPACQPHHALSDAYATGLILLAMVGQGTGWDPRTLADLLDRRSWRDRRSDQAPTETRATG